MVVRAAAAGEASLERLCEPQPQARRAANGSRLKVRDAAGAALGLEPSEPMDDLSRTSPEHFFSDRFNVTPALMERLLGGSLARRVDDADIYLEYRVNEELVLEENVVKKASRHVSQGAGVRAQAEARTGYAHTDGIPPANPEEAARQPRASADRAGASGVLAVPAAVAPTTSTRWRRRRSSRRWSASSSSCARSTSPPGPPIRGSPR